MSKLRSNYVKPQDVSSIRNVADGSIIHVEGWVLSRFGTHTFYLHDSSAINIKLQSHPALDKLIPDSTGGSIIVDSAYFRVNHEQDLWSGMWPPSKTTTLEWYEPQSGKCDCGAQHTSFNSLHSEWCSSHDLV